MIMQAAWHAISAAQGHPQWKPLSRAWDIYALRVIGSLGSPEIPITTQSVVPKNRKDLFIVLNGARAKKNVPERGK